MSGSLLGILALLILTETLQGGIIISILSMSKLGSASLSDLSKDTWLPEGRVDTQSQTILLFIMHILVRMICVFYIHNVLHVMHT